MSNELMKYATGSEVAPIRDWRVAKRAKEAADEVRLKGLQADGAMALGGHIMEGLVALDDRRHSLSSNDPVTDVLLMEIEAAVIRQVKGIQGSLYSDFGV